MATARIDLQDFHCSVCHDIFEDPVSLSCLHCYCRTCLFGLKKPSLSSNAPSTSTIIQKPRGSIVHVPVIHDVNESFTCAICRVESSGYTECRDIQADLKTIETPCPNCSKLFILCDLRKHLEKCRPTPKIGVDDVKKLFNSQEFLKKLSGPQAAALQKARSGQNRSTFPCPYCSVPNFTVETMCQHIEEKHLDDDHRRACTICPSMPWGEAGRVSDNIYLHIYHRHRFNYDTYVNYEQNEEDMVAEAVQRSMSIQ